MTKHSGRTFGHFAGLTSMSFAAFICPVIIEFILKRLGVSARPFWWYGFLDSWMVNCWYYMLVFGVASVIFTLAWVCYARWRSNGTFVWRLILWCGFVLMNVFVLFVYIVLSMDVEDRLESCY